MTDVDQRICKILAQMLEKKPAGQVITTAVAIKVLDAKFKEAFSGLNFAEKSEIIGKYLADNQKTPVATATAAATSKAAKAKESDSDSDDSDDSDDEEEDEEDEEDEEAFDSESDEEEEEPAAKKLRIELLTGDIGTRINAMINCARKVGYRPKAIQAAEGDKPAQSQEAYLNEYLTPFMQGKGMDPTRLGEADIKKYKVAKEIADLERDGANINLDRASRRGRGVTAPKAPTAPKPSFMDDE